MTTYGVADELEHLREATGIVLYE